MLQETNDNSITEDALVIRKRTNLLFFYSVSLSILSDSDLSNLDNDNIYVIAILSFCLFLIVLIFPHLKNILPNISNPPHTFQGFI